MPACAGTHDELCHAPRCRGLAFAVCSSAPKASPARLPLGCGAGQSWRKGRVYCWRGLFSPFSPPPASNLYSSPQGDGGSSGYWSWAHFICKCPCKSRALTPARCQHPSPRPWRASRSLRPPRGDGGPARSLWGTRDTARGQTLPQGWVGGDPAFPHRLHLGFPGAATVTAPR